MTTTCIYCQYQCVLAFIYRQRYNSKHSKFQENTYLFKHCEHRMSKISFHDHPATISAAKGVDFRCRKSLGAVHPASWPTHTHDGRLASVICRASGTEKKIDAGLIYLGNLSWRRKNVGDRKCCRVKLDNRETCPFENICTPDRYKSSGRVYI